MCVGLAASMGAVLLAGGAKGKRYALPNSEVMIHHPWGGARGQASDIQIQAEKILRDKRRLTKMLADACCKPYEKLEPDMDTWTETSLWTPMLPRNTV